MHPLLVAGLLELAVLVAGAIPVALLLCWLPVGRSLGWTLAFLVGSYLVAPACMLLAAGVAVRLVPKPRLGTHELPTDVADWSPDARRWLVLLSLTTIVYRTPARWAATVWPFPALLYFGVAGARIHPTAAVPPHVLIFDPYWVEVGARTVLGDGTKLSPHTVPRPGELLLGSIRIGDDVVIGGDCVLGPDVEVGDGATLVTRAGVLPGTRIPPGEVWGGNPARRISRGA